MDVSVSGLVVAVAGAGDAEGMVEVIHAAFGARPALDPPSTAIDETAETVRAALARCGGIIARVDGRPAGSILIARPEPDVATFQRVSVHPHFQRHGIASAMVAAAEQYAAELGGRRVELFARAELAELIAFWHHRGYGHPRPAPNGVVLGKALPAVVDVATADDMHALGERLAGLLRPGDLIIASGELGAGKTTLTQGIGAGLQSQGPIISPTFVLSRIHRSVAGRPNLVHVDAYRLSTAAELDDLDLDLHAVDGITVIEWGEGLAEGLSEDRLEIAIQPAAGGDGRTVVIRPVGHRWGAGAFDELRDALLAGQRTGATR